jgi:hypothetical protein
MKTMGKWRRPSQPADYEVGYGRPPKSTRFQPGRGGNPSGRPRQQRGTAALLHKALSRKIRFQQDGVTKYLSAEEMAFMQLSAKAAKGELGAIKMIVELKDRYYGSSGQPALVIHLHPDDLKL